VFLAIAVDNLANAQELTAAEEAAAAEQALKVSICYATSFDYISLDRPHHMNVVCLSVCLFVCWSRVCAVQNG